MRIKGILIFSKKIFDLRFETKKKQFLKPEYLKISRSDESEVQNSSLIGPFIEGNSFSLLCESGGGKPVPIVEWWNGSIQMNVTYELKFFKSTSFKTCVIEGE
ncbi:hypothetical protein Phum_PHUM109400 [Pediculus humanus corporis]|uniref:Ig-like domain-containing protein n=1 Tax=Pediculus humanus subsp. corporis TaxID=121224 RepID=E0VDB7_PEDHC|nr:uncharacterized protein Phum_PHUM109400 [Pediculus humanus corporis]EEB11373.1 hypothetical protein Phum_PHUM109400 [Pediculus humanus corporis]